jgi:uncharacterized protein (DUF1501 family)
MTLDRRSFLSHSGALALLAAGGYFGLETVSPEDLAAAAELIRATPALPSGTPIVVYIDLQGGNDATNMFINPNDPWYYDVAQGHGAVAVADKDLLALGSTGYALNPSMPWTAARFASHSDVAFIRGPGENVVHEFSHFSAAHYRQVASFNGSVSTGWLGRLNDLVAPNNPFASISTSGVHPALVGANTPVLSVPDVQNFNFNVGWQWQDGFLPAWKSMSNAGWPAGSATRAAEISLKDTFDAQSAVYASWNPTMSATFDSSSWLSQQLSNAAMMIAAGIPCRSYVVTDGGFDTHGSEVPAEAALFSELDTALGAFFAAIATTPYASNVFVYMSSEFGRQQTVNGSGGCDHGQAGTDVLIGGGVKGGLYGQTPDTSPNARLDDALVPTVDFRSVYATILNHLTKNTSVSQEILFGTYEDLGCFA